MLTKTYKCNVNEAVLFFRLGKAQVRAAFTGGSRFCGIPATYTTSNPVAQMAVENDPRYGKTIFLERVTGKPDPVASVQAPEKPEEKPAGKPVEPNPQKATAEPETGTPSVPADASPSEAAAQDGGSAPPTIIEDVTDVNGVIEYLKNAGVSHQSLRSVKGIRKALVEKNLQFPNVRLPEA